LFASLRRLGFGEKWNLPAQHQKIQMVKVNMQQDTRARIKSVYTHMCNITLTFCGISTRLMTR
jgi:hypothetical protein